MNDEPRAGWYPDPLQRYEYRYWRGTAWSDHVSTGGVQHEDPPTVQPAPASTLVASAPPQAPSAETVPAHLLPANRQTPVFRSARGLARATSVLLASCGLLALSLVGAYTNRSNVLDDMLDGNVNLHKARGADTIVHILSGLAAVVAIATIVLFIIWFHRVAHNNVALGRLGERYTPGWAIGGWFVPVANLWIPLRIAQDLWRGADARTLGDPDWRRSRGSAICGWWWALFLLSRVPTFIASGRTRDDAAHAIETAKSTNSTLAVANLLTAGAAVLAIAFVLKLTNRQEECYRQLAEEERGP
jgi:hypothetical protein